MSRNTTKIELIRTIDRIASKENSSERIKHMIFLRKLVAATYKDKGIHEALPDPIDGITEKRKAKK